MLLLPVPPINHDDEEMDTDVIEEKDLCEMEQHKPVILHLLSQLKLGMDLTRVLILILCHMSYKCSNEVTGIGFDANLARSQVTLANLCTTCCVHLLNYENGIFAVLSYWYSVEP